MKLSAIIIAKNEAKNIERCLASVAFADEIIVLDSGSTDDTVAKAKAFTQQVFETDWQGYGVQKQRALAHARGEWVLNLDADEVVDETLKHVIEQAIQKADIDAYRIPIQLSFYGKPLRFASRPTRHVRLFRRLGAHYSDDIVHEKIVLPENSRIQQLKTPLYHHSFQDLSHALYKLNLYSSYSAKTYTERKKKPSFSRALLSSAWMFVRCYLLQLGFMDGKAGFVCATLQAQGSFFRGMKQVYPDSHWHLIP